MGFVEMTRKLHHIFGISLGLLVYPFLSPLGGMTELSPAEESLIAQVTSLAASPAGSTAPSSQIVPPVINFNNVSIIEYIRFVSQLTGRNFIFDENDLGFNVTIISQEPVTLREIITALLQVLRIHDLILIEEKDNFIIHRNPAVKALSDVVIDNYGAMELPDPAAEIVTQVLKLNTIDADSALMVINSLISARGIVEAFKESNHIVISDFAVNVERIVKILRGVDSPDGGLTIGQYVARNTALDTLTELTQGVMNAIANQQPVTLIPQANSNSIFIITTPFLMERILPIMQRIDQREGTTGIFDLKNMRFMSYDDWRAALLSGNAGGAIGLGAGGVNQLGVGGGPLGGFEGLRGHWELDNQGHWFFQPASNGSPGLRGNPYISGLAGTVATPGAPPVPAAYTQAGQAALWREAAQRAAAQAAVSGAHGVAGAIPGAPGAIPSGFGGVIPGVAPGAPAAGVPGGAIGGVVTAPGATAVGGVGVIPGVPTGVAGAPGVIPGGTGAAPGAAFGAGGVIPGAPGAPTAPGAAGAIPTGLGAPAAGLGGVPGAAIPGAAGTAGAIPGIAGAPGAIPGGAGGAIPGGAIPGAGGLIPGAAGAIPGAGGLIPGAAGAIPGAPGAIPGAPGVIPGAAGAIPGAPGTIPGTAGVIPGAIPGAAGVIPGAVPGVPGAVGVTGAVPGGVGVVPGIPGAAAGAVGAIPGAPGAAVGGVGAIPGIPGAAGIAPGAAGALYGGAAAAPGVVTAPYGQGVAGAIPGAPGAAFYPAGGAATGVAPAGGAAGAGAPITAANPYGLPANALGPFPPGIAGVIPGATSGSTVPLPAIPLPPPEGVWKADEQGNWYFDTSEKPPLTPSGLAEQLPGPKGQWVLNNAGLWTFQLAPGESIYSGQRARFGQVNSALPTGYVENTKFYVYRLQFRKAGDIAAAIQQIGLSLADSESVNAGFLATINSLQPLEDTNALVISGPPVEIDKVNELIEELDQPVRQVYIEMLILDTTITDSLNYGVNWASRFGGGDTSGSQGFIAGASSIGQALNTTGTTNLTQVPGSSGTVTSTVLGATSLVPNGTQFATAPGYTLGIIGQHLVNKCLGMEFDSIGALVNALSERDLDNILLNPKILTEDGVAAEIFVGINTAFRTQSVANDQGQIITSNFEFRDIGTRLTVTPTLSPGNIITLQIDQEVSNVTTSPNITAGGGGGGGSSQLLSDQSTGPTTSKTTTKTRVHVPDGFFLIISGMIQDEDTRSRIQVPCLGGAPLIGGLFSYQTRHDAKRNLMIFIRPQLIDTEDQIRDLTRRQQDIFKVNRRLKPLWKHETEDAIDFMNLREETGCGRLEILDFDDEEVLRDTINRGAPWYKEKKGGWSWQRERGQRNEGGQESEHRGWGHRPTCR